MKLKKAILAMDVLVVLIIAFVMFSTTSILEMFSTKSPDANLSGKENMSFNLIANPEEAQVKAGDTVTITLSVTDICAGTNGINNIVGFLNYDESLFESVKMEGVSSNSNSWNVELNKIQNHAMYGKFCIYTLQESVTDNQDVVKLTIKLKSDLEPQSTQVDFTGLLSSDGNYEISDEDRKVVITIVEELDDSNDTGNSDGSGDSNGSGNGNSSGNGSVAGSGSENSSNNGSTDGSGNGNSNNLQNLNSPQTGDTKIILVIALALITIIINILFFTKKIKNKTLTIISIVIVGMFSFGVAAYAQTINALETANKMKYQEKLLNSESVLVTDIAVAAISPETTIENLTNKFNTSIKVLKDGSEVTTGKAETGMNIILSAPTSEYLDKNVNYQVSVTGDLNRDGKSNQVELTKIIRNSINNQNWQLSALEKLSADMNFDGNINNGDITASVRYIVYGEFASYESSVAENVRKVKSPTIEVANGNFDDELNCYEGDLTIRITETNANSSKTMFKIEDENGNSVDLEELTHGHSHEEHLNSTTSAQFVEIERENKDINGNVIKDITINKDGIYKISAITYGKLGNRSEITYEVIVKGKSNTEFEYQVEYYYEDLDGNYIKDDQATVTKTAEYKTEVLDFEDKSKEGYELDLSKGEIGAENYPLIVLKENNVMKVYYKQIDYSITYDLDQGTLEEGITNPSEYTMYTPDITLNNPRRVGYTFAGWIGTGLTDKTTTVVIAQGSKENRQYTATWEANKNTAYKVEHYKEELDGTFILAATEELTGTTDTSITATPKPYEGFSEDINNENRFATGNIEPDGSLVLKLYYTRNYYTINLGAGENIESVNIVGSQTKSFKYGETIQIEAIPAAVDGYTYTNFRWETSDTSILSNPIAEITYLTIPATDVDIAATIDRTETKYTITYELDDGTLETANPTEYTISTPAIILNNPTKQDCKFLGWTGTGLTKITKVVAIPQGSIGDRIYTAEWLSALESEYIVEHYKEKVDGSYELADTEVLGAETNTEVTAVAQQYEGFEENQNHINRNITGIVREDGTLTLKLYYSRNNYELKLNAGDNIASVNGAGTYKYGQTVDISAILEAETGYTYTNFKWETTNVDVIESTINQTTTVTMPSSNVEITASAQKELTTYTINYELNGGEVNGTNPTEYTIETEDITLINPTKQGYNFAGWTGTNLDEATETVTITKGSTGNREYTATWTTEGTSTTYKVEHYKEELDGTFKLEETETLIGETDSNVTAKANVYEGFSQNAQIPGSIMSGDIKPDGSLVLRLYYTRHMYTISLNAGENIASVSITGTEERTFKYGQTIEITAVPENADGYIYTNFKWVTTDESILSSTTNQTTYLTIPNGNIEITATVEKTINNYTISYELDGGEVAVENPTQYTVESEDIILNNPTKDGYVFTGWIGTDLTENTKEVKIAKGSTGNREYTATWRDINHSAYTVEHYKEQLDGTYVIAEKEILSGEALTEVTATSKQYEGFEENQEHVERAETGTIAEDGSLVLKLYYSRNSYELTLNAGENIASVNGAGLYKYGQTVEITAIPQAENGYTYTNFRWETADNTILADSTQTTTLITMLSQDTEITAVMDKNCTTYTISYELDGGKVEETNPTQYTMETEDITLINPTKEGYTFAGWLGTDLPEATETVVISKGSTGDRNYQATWTATSYEIIYNLDGGVVAVENPTEYTIETSDITLNNPTKQGYDFAGWVGTDLAQATQTVVISQGSIGNREYTATWKDGENVLYKVEHYKEELDGTYKLAETEEFRTNLNKEVTAIAKQYKGFTENTEHASRVVKGNVKADESLVLKLYYKRNTYTLTLNSGKYISSVIGTGSYKYGQQVQIIAVTDSESGYSYPNFKWETSDTSVLSSTTEKTALVTMPALDVEIMAKVDRVLNTYTIKYNLDGGKLEDGKTNPTEYTVESQDITLNNPTKQGYDFAGWTGTDFATATQTVTIPQGSIENREYTATWTPRNDTAYTVIHQQMNLDGKTYTVVTADTQNLTGTTGTKVTPAVKTYTGFESPATQTVTIAGDGSTVVTYSYKRLQYKFTLGSATGVTTTGSSATKNYYYGATITLKASVSSGYTWNQWTSSNTSLVANKTTANTTFTMPAGAVTMTPKATYTNVAPASITTAVKTRGTNTFTVNAKATDSNGDNITYKLYTKPVNGSTYTLSATSASTASGTQVTLTANNLSTYTVYYYYVVATDGLDDATSSTITTGTGCSGSGLTCDGPFEEEKTCTSATKCTGPFTETVQCSKGSSSTVNCGTYRASGQSSSQCSSCYGVSTTSNTVVWIKYTCTGCSGTTSVRKGCSNPNCSAYTNIDSNSFAHTRTIFTCPDHGQVSGVTHTISNKINCEHGNSSTHYYCDVDKVDCGSVSTHTYTVDINCTHGKSESHSYCNHNKTSTHYPN